MNELLCSSPHLFEVQEEIKRYQLNETGVDADTAYRIVKDQLLPEGNARQNLATFCQTYMEPQAVQLISETLDKNAIDKSLYTQTADIEDRCVEIIADLWHRPKETPSQNGETEVPKGTSTIGSSEACMLAGMAMKVRWQEWAQEYQKSHPEFDLHKKPNLIISSGYQVCWEKFEKYWDVDLVQIPIDEDHLSLNPEKLADKIDMYTIGVVAILGITYTGLYDDVKGMDQVLTQYNEAHKDRFPVQIHVDGASGGFYEPFIDPDYLWDFRLENVVSINGSGHKYGLVYPGIGWIIWRGAKYLPKKLTFEVSYLGGSVRTVGINFSKSAAHIIAQYYNFIRLGKEGYKEIHQETLRVAAFIENSLENIKMELDGEQVPVFKLLHEKAERELHSLPLVCWKLSDAVIGKLHWTLNDLSDRILMRGWQVPSYPLPANLEHVMIQRIVCRADLSMYMAEILVKDIADAVHTLNEKSSAPAANDALENQILKPHGFTH